VKYDIAIIGGGIVGLSLALSLARSDFRVVVIEAKKPQLDWPQDQLTARVSALNNASCQFLQSIDIFSKLGKAACSPLQAMHVWDHLGGGVIDFDSADIGAKQLGFIAENRELVRVLWQALSKQEVIDNVIGYAPVKIEKQTETVQLTLSNEQTIQAQLVIGADGGHSWLRDQMTDFVQRSYQQQAIVAVVQSAKSHKQVAYQNFLPEGPLGLLPLSAPDQSAIVWSNKQEKAQELLHLSEKKFNLALSSALAMKLGSLKTITSPKAIPLIMRHAKQYITERLALVGDAAHTIHPLAGQGVNLGLADVACLANCLSKAKQAEHDIGAHQTLRKYERQRRPQNQLMINAMCLFDQCFTSEESWLVHLRSQGFTLTNRSHFLKKQFMLHADG